MHIQTLRPLFSITITALLIAGCTQMSTEVPAPGIGKSVCWNNLPNWNNDNLLLALPALQQQCPKLGKKAPWQAFCTQLTEQPPQSDPEFRRMLTEHFQPHQINGKAGNTQGLFTGYYEPILRGSYQRSEQFNYPLYQRPSTMLEIDLSDRFPELKGQRVRGLLQGNRVIPFYDRAAIDGNNKPLAGEEIVWVDDADAAFFLHIQGSGRVELPDGSMVGVGYADQNGQPYVAIGKTLIEKGELSAETVSLQTIRAWLTAHPNEAAAIKNSNPSYVFFSLRKELETGPRGSLNVPLTQERSAAVDRSVIPLGTPLWINTTLPDNQPYQRLVVAQDTGGAIRGPVRADIFFGRGDRAEKLAGEMKQKGEIYALMPKAVNENVDSPNCD